MRCVVFDPQDLEALTVIEVPQHFIRELEQNKRGPMLSFAIPEPFRVQWRSDEPPQLTMPRIANVLMERFQRNDVWTWCAIALNPEICLLMRSELLPGQRREAQQREKEAFMQGLTAAFFGGIG